MILEVRAHTITARNADRETVRCSIALHIATTIEIIKAAAFNKSFATIHILRTVSERTTGRDLIFGDFGQAILLFRTIYNNTTEIFRATLDADRLAIARHTGQRTIRDLRAIGALQKAGSIWTIVFRLIGVRAVIDKQIVTQPDANKNI